LPWCSHFAGEKISCVPRDRKQEKENQEMDSHYLASVHDWQVAEEGLGMLRVPQHERNNIKDIKSLPFVLSVVEGLRERFSATCQDRY